MPKDTDASAITEALDHLMSVQEQHGEVLIHLERRNVPDIQGLTRRLEEVADAVERLTPIEVPQQSRPWVLFWGSLGLALVCGWAICWMTVRWLPGSMLPPGFSRMTPPVTKGRF